MGSGEDLPAFLNEYCIRCHGPDKQKADRRFDDVRRDISRLDARIDRLDDKLDTRFNVQTVLMGVLGVLVLFGDTIRELIGV